MQRNKKRILSEYLVAAARTGDRRAFDRLARLWHADLLRHAYRLMGEADAAEDVLQDAWLDIIRSLGRLRDGAAFPAWAYRIVTRKAARLIRKRQRLRQARQIMATEGETLVDGEARAETAAGAAQIARAMAALPPEQRSAIALYHRQEFSIAEIATALDVPVGTVKTRLMHARRKIRAVLEGEPKGDQNEPDRQRTGRSHHGSPRSGGP